MESKKQKSLGLEIDKNLNYNAYVTSLSKKAGKKLSVFVRLLNFMSIKQIKVLMEFFTTSQFGYCPLIRNFHGRGVNNKINHLHER